MNGPSICQVCGCLGDHLPVTSKYCQVTEKNYLIWWQMWCFLPSTVQSLNEHSANFFYLWLSARNKFVLRNIFPQWVQFNWILKRFILVKVKDSFVETSVTKWLIVFSGKVCIELQMYNDQNCHVCYQTGSCLCVTWPYWDATVGTFFVVINISWGICLTHWSTEYRKDSCLQSILNYKMQNCFFTSADFYSEAYWHPDINS